MIWSSLRRCQKGFEGQKRGTPRRPTAAFDFHAPPRRFPVFHLDLPADNTLPTRGGDVTIEDPPAFAFPFVAPRTEEEGRAIAVWINSHLVFFLSLNVGTHAARRALDGARAGDRAGLALWLRRLVVLRLGHVSFTRAAANLTREEYESYVRPAMQSMRTDFSGVSSADNWAFSRAMADLTQELPLVLERWSPGDAAPARAELAAYRDADREWWAHHGRIMGKLISAPQSLARMEYERRREAGETITYDEFKAVLRAPEAMAENDRFFAVRRSRVGRAQFRHNLELALALVAPFQDPSGPLPRYWSTAAEAMAEIAGEP